MKVKDALVELHKQNPDAQLLINDDRTPSFCEITSIKVQDQLTVVLNSSRHDEQDKRVPYDRMIHKNFFCAECGDDENVEWCFIHCALECQACFLKNHPELMKVRSNQW